MDTHLFGRKAVREKISENGKERANSFAKLVSLFPLLNYSICFLFPHHRKFNSEF